MHICLICKVFGVVSRQICVIYNLQVEGRQNNMGNNILLEELTDQELDMVNGAGRPAICPRNRAERIWLGPFGVFTVGMCDLNGTF